MDAAQENPTPKIARKFLQELGALDKSTVHDDNAGAEAHIRTLYKHAGLPVPEKIVWCKSPLGMAAALILLEMDKPNMQGPGLDMAAFLRDNIKAGENSDALWADARRVQAEARGLYDNPRNGPHWMELRSIADPAFAPMMLGLGGTFNALVEEVFALTRSAAGGANPKSPALLVYRTLSDTLRSSTANLARTLVSSETACAPIGFARDYIALVKHMTGDVYREMLHSQFELSRRAAWITACPRLCLAVAHGTVNVNPVGLLHNATGAALVFPDGWKIYAWNGVHVPPDVIENPRGITMNRIDNERNAAVRQVMIERYQGNYYNDCGAVLVATDDLGKLYRKKRRGGDKDFVFVRVTNSTREPDGHFKEYTLRVPPEMKTPTEAIAWTFNMTTGQYLKTQKMT